MKKKIIVLSHWLELGGAERSLIGLLNAFDKTKYDVDLFLCRHTGELMQSIPEEVHLLPEIPQAAAIAKPVKGLLKNPKYWGILAARLTAKVATKIYYAYHKPIGECSAEFNFVHKFVQPFIPQIQQDVEYDLAISFLAPHYIAVNKVKTKKKIAWIHTDYQNIDVNVNSERKIWSRYDYIASISEKCTENFKKKFGNLGNEVVLIENILDSELIRNDAEKTIELQLDSTDILLCSVGRYGYAKNFDNVPFICKYMVEYGYNIKWLLIGFGGDEELIRNKIKEVAMEDHVFLLGKKDNPYPYIKRCQIYVQPSRYEGKAVTVREAQILRKPVVITNFATAKSQLEDGVDGIIVPLENEACAQGIMRLIDDMQLQRRFSENCAKRDYSNAIEVKKIYQLIEEN